VRAERERARWRLHLVRHRTALKNRIHATLLAFGHPCPVSDLFGTGGRQLLARLALPEPWAGDTTAALHLIDELDHEIAECERALRQVGADHRYVPLLMTTPGIGWVLGYTIAAEIGDISRFASPTKLAGYTGLCPRVYQSGGKDHRGPLAKNGPKYLRWALIEAATHASRHPLYAERYRRTKTRLGRQRAPRSPRSTWPAGWPKRSGTCCPPTSPSPRQAPPSLWPRRGPPTEMRHRSEAPPIHLVPPLRRR
jgi:transposase